MTIWLTRVLGSGIVEPDSLECQILLLVIQELGGRRVGRKDEHGRDGEDESDQARHEEDPLIWVQASSLDLGETI